MAQIRPNQDPFPRPTSAGLANKLHSLQPIDQAQFCIDPAAPALPSRAQAFCAFQPHVDSSNECQARAFYCAPQRILCKPACLPFAFHFLHAAHATVCSHPASPPRSIVPLLEPPMHSELGQPMPRLAPATRTCHTLHATRHAQPT